MADIRSDILSALGRRARFVAELARLVDGDTDALERTLDELEAEGAVLVREQYCADPHMAGTDLRIAARVGGPADAIAQIDARWQRWLGDYLASHRCS